jgi:hypothetical protein
MLILALLFALLLAGCVPGNIQGMVAEMAKSPRSWCLAATGYGVNLKVGGSGTGEHGGEADMSCSDGGLSLKAQGANQVGVPLVLTPQLSIGQPTLVQPPAVPAPRAVPQMPRAVPQAAPAPLGDAEVLWISDRPHPRGRGTLTDAEVRDVLRTLREMHGPRMP